MAESASQEDRERRGHAEVLAIVSHDIRAPLGVILGAVTELLDPTVGSLNDDQRALVQIVRRSSERLARLAANVLVLNRLAVGPLELRRQRIDARTIVRRAIESFERSGELGRLAVATSFPDESIEVDVDPERVGHAIVNVLANAVRFARGQIRVTVAPQSGAASVAIEDDGPGISPEPMARFFDPNELPALGDAPPARGVGLIVARAIVAAHQGAVTGDTLVAEGETAPRGARVAITLPRA
jgi:signal transduction histidine kinase